jgi:hypothetical protein
LAAKKTHTEKVGDPKFKGPKELYGSTRGKLRKERGKARDGTCEHRGCKETATAWVFVERDGITVFIDRNGLRFSDDLSAYRRLCGEHRGAHQKKTAATRSKSSS